MIKRTVGRDLMKRSPAESGCRHTFRPGSMGTDCPRERVHQNTMPCDQVCNQNSEIEPGGRAGADEWPRCSGCTCCRKSPNRNNRPLCSRWAQRLRQVDRTDARCFGELSRFLWRMDPGWGQGADRQGVLATAKQAVYNAHAPNGGSVVDLTARGGPDCVECC